MKLHSLLKKFYWLGWQSKTLNLTACEAFPNPSVKPEFHILHVWLWTHAYTLHWSYEVSRNGSLVLLLTFWIYTYCQVKESRPRFYSSSCNRVSVALSKSSLCCPPSSLCTDYFTTTGYITKVTWLPRHFPSSPPLLAPQWLFCTATRATACLLCSLPSLSAHTALAEGSWHSSTLAFQPDSYQVHSQFSCSILNFQACVLCIALLPYYTHSHVHVDFPLLQILWSFPTQPHDFLWCLINLSRLLPRWYQITWSSQILPKISLTYPDFLPSQTSLVLVLL